MIITREMASSDGCEQKDKWETPEHIFRPLNEEFNFTLDPCAETETAKCAKFYTEADDGLEKDWSGEIVFCNPPYSRANINMWTKKCYQESLKGVVIVALLPVSTSARWFHHYVYGKADIRYYKGRIRFNGAPYTAPFSSMLAIYNAHNLLKTPSKYTFPSLHVR